MSVTRQRPKVIPLLRSALVGMAVTAGALAPFGALRLYTPQVSALTPTPPPSPLTWTFDVSPASPVVSDDIKLTAFASGEGGLPQYTLVLEDSPALLTLESASSVATGGPARSAGELGTWER